MPDLIPIELREPIWYIIAGFILGFAVSTLWEWLYFRRFRAESEVESQGGFTAGNSDISSTATTPILQKAPEFEPANAPGTYRSPTVFLNRERTQTTTHTVFTKTEQKGAVDELTQTTLSEAEKEEKGNFKDEPLTETSEVAVSTLITKSHVEDETPSISSTDGLDEAAVTDEYEPPKTEALTPIEHTIVSEQNRTESRVPRSRGYPDDLTKIRGIGEVYKRRLFAAHIFTFHHVATSDVEVLRRATQAAPNANVDSWPAQAEELAQKYQRTNASYSGPLPDDLQQIPGIGPYFAQTLYRSGICTFEQLADASLEELRSIFPPSVLGREIDLQQWLDIAQEEANKRK